MEDLPYSENENQSFGGAGVGSRFGEATTQDVYASIYSEDEQRELGLLDSGGSNLWDIASQFGGGFLQGFTTIKFGEDPSNTVEAIANNLGHLFGFMGVVPGVGTVGSTAAKATVKGLGLASRTVGLGSKAARYGKQTAKGLSGFRSVPFLAGDAVMKGAKAIGKTKAAGAAMKYMKRSPTLAKHFGKAGVGRDVAEGFLHMGSAGAASAWQGGVDQMMEAFLMTGALGSVDRVAGNLIPHKGPGTPDLSTLLDGGENAARMAARGLSVGMFSGGISTARGAPLEMQMYEYLLGAWFGGKEVSRPQRRAFEFLQESGMTDPVQRAENVGRAQREALELQQQAKNAELRFAETLPGYDDLRSDVQDFVDLESEAQFGRFMMLPDAPGAQEEGLGGAMEGAVAASRAVRETVQRFQDEGRPPEEIQSYIDGYREAEAESARKWQAGKQRAASEQAEARAGDGDTQEGSGSKATDTDGAEGPNPLDLNIFLQQAGLEARRETQAQLESPAREVQRAVEDHNIPTELASPVMRFARSVYEGNDDFSPAPEKFFVETLTTAKQTYEDKGADGFEDFVGTVKNRYGIEIEGEAQRELRSQWLRGAYHKPEAQRTIDLTGDQPTITKTPPVNDKGARTARARPPSHLEQTAGRRAALETVRVEVGPGDTDPRSGFERPDDAPRETVTAGVFDAIEHGYLSMGDLTRMAERDGFAIAGGVKDNDRLALIEAELSPDEAMSYMRDQMAKMRDVDSEVGQPSERVTSREVWKENVKQFANERDLNPNAQSTWRSYAYHWANNAKMFEAVNGGMEWAEMYRASRTGEGDFMLERGVTEFNKRMQVMDAGDIPVTNKAWAGIDDVARTDANPAPVKGWARSEDDGYEVSSKGDSRFSALNARLPDGRTIEEAYQLDVKGYRSEGDDWRLGKSKPPKKDTSIYGNKEASYAEYKKLWRKWAEANPELVEDLRAKAAGKTLTDRFATTNVNQARALAEILNETTPEPEIAGGIRIGLINSVPSGAESGQGLKYQVEGEDLLTYFRRNDRGEVVEAIHDQHMDGVYFLRDDVFEALADYGGWKTDTGAQKGVTRHADDNGLLLGKYAYHRAGPELSKAMGEKHGLMTSEAAKQTGTRETYDMQFTRDGEIKFYREGSTRPVEPETYTLDEGAMTISQGTGEKGDPKDVRLMMQLSGNMNKFQSPDGAESVYDNFHRPAFEGEEIQNQRVDEYRSLMQERADTDDPARTEAIDKELGAMAQDLDPERVGVQAMIDFFNAPVQSDNPMFEKMARHVFELDLNDMMPEAYESRQVEQQMRELTEQRSAANVITEAAEKLTPAIVDHKLVRPYFQGALRGYLVTKTIRPKVKHSWKGIMTPYHSDIRRDNDLGRNDFMLHEGMRSKEVKWGEGTKTLGEAWSLFQEAGGWTGAPPQMQKDMTVAAMRAPSDSMSGTQPLKFRGFTKTKGYGAVLHPKTMEYLGGADLDIDSAFFMQSLPADMMAAIERNKKEWETTDDQGRNVLLESKNKDEDFVERFSDDPEENARLSAIQGHPLSMNDPMKRMEAGMSANRGNKLLGFGLNAAKRWHVIAEESPGGRVQAEIDPDKASERWLKSVVKRLKEKGVGEERITLRWTGTLKDDRGATIRSYKRDVVNYAADAANYAGLISRYDISDLIGRKAMDRVEVVAETEDGRTISLGRMDTSSKLPFRVSNNDQYRALSKADKFLKGKDYQKDTAFSLKEVIGGLSDVRPELPRNMTNSWYRVAKDLGRLDAQERFRMLEDAKLSEGRMAIPPWLGKQYINFKKVFDEVYAQDTPVAETARQLLRRQDLTVFTESRGEHPAQQFKATKPEGRETPITRATSDTEAERVKDFPVNDLTDVATAVEGVRIGRKMIEKYGEEDAVARAQELAGEAAKIRQEAAKMLGRSKKKKRQQEAAISQDRALRDVIEEARGIVEGLGDLEREFFETYLMGSLTPQDQPLSARPERRAMLEERRRAVAENNQERIAELDQKLDQDRKDWYATNQTGSSLLLGVVRDDTVARFMDRYNEVVQATQQKSLSKEDIREAVQRGSSLERLAAKEPAVEGARGGTDAEAEADRWTRQVFDQIAPEIARAEGELSERGQRIKERLKTLFYKNPSLLDNFADAAPGIISEGRASDIATAPEQMTLADIEQYVSFFDQVGKHDYWGMTEEEREEMPLPLKRRHYFLFPERFDRMHLPFDRGSVTLEKPVATGEGVQKGDVRVYLSKMGQMHNFWKTTNRHIDQQTNAEQAKLLKSFEMIESLGREGEILWDTAIAQRERRESGDKDHYEREYERAMSTAREEGVLEKTFKVKVGDELQSLTGQQIIDRVNKRIAGWSEYTFNKYVDNDAAERFLVYKDGNEGLDPENREINVRETMARINDAVLKGSDPPMLGFNALSRISHQYLLDKTEVKVERQPGQFETIRLGDIQDPQLRLKKRRDLLEGRPDLAFKPTEQRDPTTYWPHNGHPQRSVQKAIERQIKEAQSEGVSEVQKDRIEVAAKATAQRQNAPDGGALSPERAEQMDRRTISADEVETRGLRYKPGHLYSRGSFGDKTLPGYRRDLDALATYQRQVINAHHSMTADLMSRVAIDSFRRQKPMGEYTEAWANFMNIYNRDQIGFPSIFPQSWLDDPNMSLGTSEEEGWLGGAVASNPYYWFTDDSIQRKAKWMGEKMGFDGAKTEGRSIRPPNDMSTGEREMLDRYLEQNDMSATALNNTARDTPEALPDEITDVLVQEGPQSKAEARAELDGTELLGSYFHDGELVSQKVRAFSQWEGKWQLMSLLAHSKSYVNNIFGGNIHTAVNSGMKPWAKAKDVGYLRNVAGLNIESKEGAQRFVEEHGGVENFIVNEVDISNRFRTDKLQNFADDVVRAIKKNPEIEDATLMEMAERRGISDTVMNGAAFFMRKSERALRSRSFLAHYAKAQESLGMGGDVFKSDHPWLIKQANKGVEATQFLYHNASRPAFSRTPLGRIFSRFQLFTWNSVRFRNRIYQDARNAGYEVPEGPSIPYGQGPEAYKRLQRLATADLFVLGLASLFPYSLFESSVPPHLEWGRDAAALLFGDEEDQERAFFGTGKLGPLAPLQAIQPPSTRILQPLFISMMEDDWSRFVDYHLPVMLPFGRLGRNVYRTYENPIRVSEEMMGLPVIDAQRKLREMRERESYVTPFQLDPFGTQ